MIRRHLQLLLCGPIAERIEALRREWDPVMADRAPAHVTLIYPEECAEPGLLIERAAQVARRTSPLSITLGDIASEKRGRGGVWRLVVDESPTWKELRAQILEFSLFVIDQWRGEIRNCAPHEHEEVRWASLLELEQLPLAHPLYRVALAQAFRSG